VPEPRRERSYLRGTGPLHFHCASGFCTQILAYMLDSLVRVSRRVDKNHLVNIPISLSVPALVPPWRPAELCSPKPRPACRTQDPTTKRPRDTIPQSSPTYGKRTITGPTAETAFPYICASFLRRAELMLTYLEERDTTTQSGGHRVTIKNTEGHTLHSGSDNIPPNNSGF
jgi:hypothetical protein